MTVPRVLSIVIAPVQGDRSRPQTATEMWNLSNQPSWFCVKWNLQNNRTERKERKRKGCVVSRSRSTASASGFIGSFDARMLSGWSGRLSAQLIGFNDKIILKRDKCCVIFYFAFSPSFLPSLRRSYRVHVLFCIHTFQVHPYDIWFFRSFDVERIKTRSEWVNKRRSLGSR